MAKAKKATNKAKAKAETIVTEAPKVEQGDTERYAIGDTGLVLASNHKALDSDAKRRVWRRVGDDVPALLASAEASGSASRDTFVSMARTVLQRGYFAPAMEDRSLADINHAVGQIVASASAAEAEGRRGMFPHIRASSVKQYGSLIRRATTSKHARNNGGLPGFVELLGLDPDTGDRLLGEDGEPVFEDPTITEVMSFISGLMPEKPKDTSDKARAAALKWLREHSVRQVADLLAEGLSGTQIAAVTEVLAVVVAEREAIRKAAA